MILGIESVYGDKRLVGNAMSLDELKNAVKEILKKQEANKQKQCYKVSNSRIIRERKEKRSEKQW